MAINQTVSLPYPSTEKVTSTFAEGATLKVQYKSYQVMSDVWEQGLYAEYWDEATQSVKTADWINAGSKVDATPEVMAKVKNFYYERALAEAKAKAEEEARCIVKGSVVKVARGRASKGVQGKVVVSIDRPYQMGWKSVMAQKVAIATSDVMIKVPAANGRVYDNYRDVVWAWARNVELVEIPAIDMKEVEERARTVSEWKVKDLKVSA